MQILLLLLCLKIRANIKVEVGQASNIEKIQDLGREVHGFQKYFACCKWMLCDNFLFSQCCSECKSLKEIVQEARFSIDEQSTSFKF